MTTKKRHHKEEEKKERIEEPEPQKFVQPKPAEDKDQTDEEILEMLGEPEPAEIKEKEPPTTIQFHDRIKTIDISGKEEMREPPEIQPMESEPEPRKKDEPEPNVPSFNDEPRLNARINTRILT